jgi:hypothetical protein
MIKPVLNYVSTVWTSCNKENLGQVLKRCKKERPRVICKALHGQASSVKLFNHLQWVPFYEDAKIAKCCLAYKRIKNNVPAYIEDSLKLNSNQHIRVPPDTATVTLFCPRCNPESDGGKTFAVTTCKLWNSLRLDLRHSVSLRAFRNNYRNSIFNEQKELQHFIT